MSIVTDAEFVELRSADALGTLKVSCRLGDGEVEVTGGGGGWEAVPRPGREPLTVWRGPPEPLRLTLPLLLDGWSGSPEGVTVEKDISTLEAMAGIPNPGKALHEPPLLVVEGALPHDESRQHGNRWVMEAPPVWGEAIRRRRDGHRVRQAFTVTLMLFAQLDRVSRRKAPHPGHKFVKSKYGDTFLKLASRYCKTRRLGTRLAKLNGKRSPDVTLKTNTKIKVPVGGVLKDWLHDLK